MVDRKSIQKRRQKPATLNSFAFLLQTSYLDVDAVTALRNFTDVCNLITKVIRALENIYFSLSIFFVPKKTNQQVQGRAKWNVSEWKFSVDKLGREPVSDCFDSRWEHKQKYSPCDVESKASDDSKVIKWVLYVTRFILSIHKRYHRTPVTTMNHFWRSTLTRFVNLSAVQAAQNISVQPRRGHNNLERILIARTHFVRHTAEINLNNCVIKFYAIRNRSQLTKVQELLDWQRRRVELRVEVEHLPDLVETKSLKPHCGWFKTKTLLSGKRNVGKCLEKATNFTLTFALKWFQRK